MLKNLYNFSLLSYLYLPFQGVYSCSRVHIYKTSLPVNFHAPFSQYTKRSSIPHCLDMTFLTDEKWIINPCWSIILYQTWVHENGHWVFKALEYFSSKKKIKMYVLIFLVFAVDMLKAASDCTVNFWLPQNTIILNLWYFGQVVQKDYCGLQN